MEDAIVNIRYLCKFLSTIPLIGDLIFEKQFENIFSVLREQLSFDREILNIKTLKAFFLNTRSQLHLMF